MLHRNPVPCRSRSLLFLLLAPLLAAMPAGAGAADASFDPASFDPARVGWSEIRMTASKLFLTADARLALRTVPGATVGPDLLPVTDDRFTPVAPGAEVLELLYETRAVGRRSRIMLLMDPFSGAALQRTQHDQDGKMRLRTYRFGLEGAYQRTRYPATASEKSLLPDRWTRTSEGLRVYAASPGKQPVIEATGLLYAVGAASLDQPGDTIDLLVRQRRDTQVVRIAVLAPREVSVGYDELWPRGTVRRSGKIRPVRLSLQALPVRGDNAETEDLELLGLRGRLELLLHPDTRAPLQLSGDVKVVGSVTLRLAAVRPR